MATQESQFTTIAGEHYVAHKLAMLGFIPAIVRQGVRSMDLLVASQDGGRTIAVQVESAASAARESAGGTGEMTLQFPLSQRSLELASDNTIFCFVDLQTRQPANGPDVYVMTTRELREELGAARLRKYSYLRYVRPSARLARFRNNWRPFHEALNAEPAAGPRSPAHGAGLQLHSRMQEWDLAELRDQPA